MAVVTKFGTSAKKLKINSSSQYRNDRFLRLNAKARDNLINELHWRLGRGHPIFTPNCPFWFELYQPTRHFPFLGPPDLTHHSNGISSA